MTVLERMQCHSTFLIVVLIEGGADSGVQSGYP